MSNITLNIVAPDTPTPTPVDPVVPNTGLFTHGIGGTEATVITMVSIVLILTIVAIVLAVLYKKHKKQGKTTKLVHVVESCKAIVSNKKRATAGLMAIAFLVSAGTFVALARNGANAADTDETPSDYEPGLTVDVSSEELTIEVGDEPVFAVLPVDVTVEEATLVGYTLTAYTDSTDLVSTTNPDNIIPMVTLPESSVETLESSETAGELTPLTDNTYGLALGNEPTTKDAEVYMPLSIDSDAPTILKTTDYAETEANDTTTIYYGFYITPDMPYGTYTNDSEVCYNATVNTTLVTFDGKGLYFDEEQTQSTNTVEYIAVSQEKNETETSSTINQPISGEYKTPSQALPYNFLGWSTDPESTEPTYTSDDDIAEHLPISPNIPLTLYAVWQKATTITYDSNGGAGTMDTQTIIAGESANLSPNTFTKDGYTFTGWNTVATPTEQTPGKSYTDKELYQAEAESANVTLFAQWEEILPVISDLTYMQDFATLSEAGKASILGSMTVEQQYQLKDNRDGKLYYVSKLADENVWMTQNLDHNIVSTPNFYTYANTDIGHGSTPNPSATWTGTATYSTGTTTWNGSYTAPESYDPGALYWNGVTWPEDKTTCMQYGGTWERGDYGSYCLDANLTSTTGDTNYHLGNYYNWTAAVAMNDSSTHTASKQDVDQSICPAGWMLPKSGNQTGSGSFAYLDQIRSNYYKELINKSLFSFSGSWRGNSPSSVGQSGMYWSSIVSPVSNSAYNLLISYNYGISVMPDNSNNRSRGYPLRCVVR